MISEMDDVEREAAYAAWKDACRCPLKRIPMPNTATLANELQEGGITLDPTMITTLVKHRDKIILIEVPLALAEQHSLSDLHTHAAYLLARLRTHSPKRVRLIAYDTGNFGLVPLP